MPNKADLLFGFLVFYGLIFGLRRGFYKELIAFTALIVAIGAARTWRDPAGELIHQNLSFLPAGFAHALGAVVVWIVAFFLVNLVGRLLLKKARNPDAENKIEGAAGKVADSVEGDTKAGPMTLLTNPIASAQRRLVYWSDKLLGGLLGVIKGAAAGYAIFAVIYFVDLQMGSLKSFKDSIAASKSAAFYQAYLSGLLQQLPEYRLVDHAAKTEELKSIVDQNKTKDPQLIDRVSANPNWAAIKATAAFQGVALDPEIQALWAKRDLEGLMLSPKVRHLLADDAFQQAFANTDVDSVIRSVTEPAKPQ